MVDACARSGKLREAVQLATKEAAPGPDRWEGGRGGSDVGGATLMRRRAVRGVMVPGQGQGPGPGGEEDEQGRARQGRPLARHRTRRVGGQ